MQTDFAPKMARVLTEYSVPIKKGDLVGIMANITAQPLIEALYEAILRLGAIPHVVMGLPTLGEIYMDVASDEQLAFCNPINLYAIEHYDALFQVISPLNTKSMATVDPARVAKSQKGNRPIIEKYFERINDKSLNWNITAWPTQASAQEAEMGLNAYADFVYRACGLDQADPVAYWTNFRERQTRLTDWLQGKKHAEVRGPGVELSFDFTDRPWVSCHGTVNFPDGEIFTSPIENSMNGYVEFNYPSMFGGREVNGTRLVFKDGRCVEASAKKNEEYLLSQLDMDDGSRCLGEFAIGTNMGIQKFTGEILFDEKIGGTFHMALGEGIAESGGLNKSAIHWDMIHGMRDGGEVYIDGELFYKSGEFVVE